MKKYLLMLAAFAATTVALSSCVGPEPPKTKTTPADGVLTTVDSGTYYGEMLGEGTGFYDITLSNNNGEKLRLGCFGTIASNSANAKLTTGDYTIGTKADHKLRTFFAAENSSAEYGTIYWLNGEANIITDGTLKVSSTGGKTKIVATLKAGAKDIVCTFDNNITLKADVRSPAHTEDVIVAKKVWSRYMGKELNPEATAGTFILTLLETGDVNNKNAHALQVEGHIPFPADNNNAMVPEGTYNVVSAKDYDKYDPYTIVVGDITIVDNTTNAKEAVGSLEYYADEKGNYSYGWVITGGSIKVEKSGDNYKITANLKGKRADKVNVIGKEDEDILFSYEGPMAKMQNYADPQTQFLEDKDFGTQPIEGSLCNIGNIQGKASIWQYFFFGEGVKGELNGTTISITGVGDVVVAYLVGPKSTADLGVGYYPMSESFYAPIDPSKNVSVPADPYIKGFSGPQNGFYHLHYNADKTVSISGAMPEQGFVNTTLVGNTYTVNYEFRDRYNNKITGKYEGDKNTMQYVGREGTRASSGLIKLDPSYTYIMK